MNKKKKENVERYCTPIGDGKYVTTTVEGDFLCLHSMWIVPLHKRITNYVIEEYDKKD